MYLPTSLSTSIKDTSSSTRVFVAMKRPWSMVQSSNRIDILGMYILPRTYVLLYFPLNQQILVHFSQTAPSSRFMEKQPENSTQRWIWSCFTNQPPKYRNLWSATLGKVLQFTAWNVAYLKQCETISRPVGLGFSGFASQKAQIKFVTTSPHKKVTENTHKLRRYQKNNNISREPIPPLIGVKNNLQ